MGFMMTRPKLAKVKGGSHCAAVEGILRELRGMANPRNVEGMARFGINPKNTLGISVTDLKPIATRIGRDHGLALALWETDVHEARILAFLVDDRKQVTEEQM
jgi:3-methyladenine DNA glycosylase AlkD